MEILDIIIIIAIFSIIIIYYKFIYPIADKYFDKSVEKYFLLRANPLFDASSAHFAIVVIIIIITISILNYYFR